MAKHCCLLHFQRNFTTSRIHFYKYRAVRPVKTAKYPKPFPDEYTETPEYPPLIPNLFKKSVELKKYQRQQEWNSIRDLPTVTEKLNKLSEREWRVWLLPNMPRVFNNLPFYQYVTKTALVKNLPELYNDINVDEDYENLKPHLLDAILLQLEYRNRFNIDNDSNKSQIRTKELIDHFVRVITVGLSAKYPNLFDTRVDREVRCEAFWWRGGYKIEGWMIPEIGNETAKTPFQYMEKPFLQIRSRLPLPEFVPRNHKLDVKEAVPVFNYNPGALGHFGNKQRFTSIPGHWPGDPYDFGQVAFYICDRYELLLNKYGEEEIKYLLTGHGILSSFSWLASIATYKGFSPFHEITYPLTCQTVLTPDAKIWKFVAYQLNTLALWELDEVNQFYNICWTSEPMNLFEKIEGGQVLGLNDEVLKLIIKFIVNQPRERGVDLRPYLKNKNEISQSEDIYQAIAVQ